MELALAQRGGQISLLALAWAKAFDSINVLSLMDALRRFSLPSCLLQKLQNLLEARTFSVKDCGAESVPQKQRSGISRGCTLSPLLFVLVMTVLLQDALDMLSDDARAAYQRGSLSDVVFADDTLLMGVRP